MSIQGAALQKYRKLVGLVQEWIASGALKPGDRMPSVREMSKQRGYSTVTVHHAYVQLESEGLLEARQRSGFYVTDNARSLPEFSASNADFERASDGKQPTARALLALAESWGSQNVGSFGDTQPSPDLLPTLQVHNRLLGILRRDPSGGDFRAAQNMDLALREVIARRLIGRGLSVSPDNIMLTGSAGRALEICLEWCVAPGDTVLVESPCPVATVQKLTRRNIRCVEIYSHPRHGIDPSQLEHLVSTENISTCVLMPNNHAPTGISYPVSTMHEVAQIASKRGITIIEDDTCGELGHASQDATTIRQLDLKDRVIQVGGFATTIGARYGIGWIVMNAELRAAMARHGRHDEPLAAESATQLALADYLNRRGYERHLRRLRELLSARTHRGLNLISKHLPSNCAVSRPSGGFTCWIRGPGDFDSLEAARIAAQHGVTFLPGPMFSITRSFHNFLALNLSAAWNEDDERDLALIGRLLRREDVGPAPAARRRR